MKTATPEVKRLRLMALLIQRIQQLSIEDQEFVAKKIMEGTTAASVKRLVDYPEATVTEEQKAL